VTTVFSSSDTLKHSGDSALLLTTIAIDEYGLPIQVPIFYPLQADGIVSTVSILSTRRTSGRDPTALDCDDEVS
jgi:hypothetical protein